MPPPKPIRSRKRAPRRIVRPEEQAIAATPAPPSPDEPISPTTNPSRLSLSRDKRDLLAAQLLTDLSRLESVFSTYRAKIQEFRDLYDGDIEPTLELFDGQSKVFVPLPRVIKDAAHSRIFQTLFQQKEIVICESALQDGDVERMHGFKLHESLKALQRSINKLALDENELNIKEKCDALLHEITVTGTCPTRVAHDYRVLPKKKRYSPKGEIIDVANFVERDEVCISPLPIESCLWDITADSGELRFFSYDYHQSYNELMADAAQQEWDPSARDAVLASPDSIASASLSDTLKRERLSTTLDETIRRTGAGFTFTEAYYRNWMISDDTYADIVVTFHKATGQILRIILWPYIHNMLPIILVHYEQIRMRPIGRGAIEPVASIAAGVNAISNQTINSTMIRDNPGIIVPAGSMAADKLEAGWHPGIIIQESKMGEVRTFEFAQTGNTQVSLALMDRLFQIAFQVSHLGPSQFGDVSESRRSPASLGLSIIQQGAELIDKIINRFRISVGRILLQAFAIYWQTNPGKIRQTVGEEDFILIEKLMTSVGVDNLRVTLAVTSATHSKELDRQNYLATIQTVMNYSRQVLELVRAMEGGMDPKTGQPIPPSPTFNAVAMDILRTSHTLMTRWIESSPQITDSSAIITDAAQTLEDAKAALAKVQEQIQGMQGQMGMGGMGGGMGAPPPNIAGNLISPTFPGAVGPGAGALLPG